MRGIGIRCDLGGPVGRVRRDLVREGTDPAVIGLAIRVASSSGLAQLLRGMYFDVGPIDPSTYSATCGAVVPAALLAHLYHPYLQVVYDQQVGGSKSGAWHYIW